MLVFQIILTRFYENKKIPDKNKSIKMFSSRHKITTFSRGNNSEKKQIIRFGLLMLVTGHGMYWFSENKNLLVAQSYSLFVF
jgi:hypothetical protein